jgi:DNA-binding transcriptional MerR regulator
MKNGDETLWTIDELGERVAEALLGPGYWGVPSGRVRDVPDLRTIRYYTTVGLLDRPAAMRGRTALYGERHLLQLVAIKRLQAQGLTLAAVQERVVGLSNKGLRRLAAAEGTAARGDVSSALAAASGERDESFWRVQPQADEEQAAAESPVARSVALEAGLVVTLAAGPKLNDDDLRVIRMAAAPLIEILRLRGLIDVGPDELPSLRRVSTGPSPQPSPKGRGSQ